MNWERPTNELSREYDEGGDPEKVLEQIKWIRLDLDSLEQYIMDNEDEVIIE
jgi:hypothetical protein